MATPGKSTLSTYGGPFVNAYPVTNGATDQNAVAANQQMVDTAAMTRTACRAWVRMTIDSSTTPTLVSQDSMWGGNPVNLPPVLVRVAPGEFTVTWAGTTGGLVVDEQNAQQALNFQRAVVVVELSLTLYWATVPEFTANSVGFIVFGFTGGAPAVMDAPGAVAHVMVF